MELVDMTEPGLGRKPRFKWLSSLCCRTLLRNTDVSLALFGGEVRGLKGVSMVTLAVSLSRTPPCPIAFSKRLLSSDVG